MKKNLKKEQKIKTSINMSDFILDKKLDALIDKNLDALIYPCGKKCDDIEYALFLIELYIKRQLPDITKRYGGFDEMIKENGGLTAEREYDYLEDFIYHENLEDRIIKDFHDKEYLQV